MRRGDDEYAYGSPLRNRYLLRFARGAMHCYADPHTILREFAWSIGPTAYGNPTAIWDRHSYFSTLVDLKKPYHNAICSRASTGFDLPRQRNRLVLDPRDGLDQARHLQKGAEQLVAGGVEGGGAEREAG